MRDLRRRLREREGEVRKGLESTRGALVRVLEPSGVCALCAGPMKVQKTRSRPSRTLDLGEVEVVEPFYVCRAGCRSASGKVVSRRSPSVADRLLPHRSVGYDLMTWVGLQRFVHHRQREEIQQAAERELGIRLSAGTISDLTRQFVACLEALHQERAPALAATMVESGGWPLHVDATGEDGRGMLLVAIAGWTGWVLGAWRIPTEREDQILPHLRRVCTLFGRPVACVRDLGRAMIPALINLVVELGGDIPILSCHFHFLKDVGKDLLDAPYTELRQLLRSSKIRPRLRTLARDLGRTLGTDLLEIRDELGRWLSEQSRALPSGPEGLAIVRALAQWVLDYAVESENLRFPFDRPYLDLCVRAQRVRRALDDLHRRSQSVERPVRRALDRLIRAVDPVATDPAFTSVMRQLAERATLLDRLREVLHLSGDSTDDDVEAAELHDARVNLDRFRDDLRRERPARGPAQNRREAVDVVQDHLDRHGDSLWGHAIPIAAELGGGTRLVARTNNRAENLFQALKHGERRRSGRKSLARELENLPAGALLVANLSSPEYVRILCGTLDRLPEAFAKLQADKGSVAVEDRSAPACLPPESPETVESASLPRDDRAFVRSPAFATYVLNAARSRAPRVTI